MQEFLFKAAFFMAKLFLKGLLTSDVRTTVYDAIDTAEKVGGTGQEKMQTALGEIRKKAPRILRQQGESALRTVVELALDKYL